MRRVPGCSGKLRYADEREARRKLKALKKKYGRKEFARLEAYECAFCGAWHLGNRPKVTA